MTLVWRDRLRIEVAEGQNSEMFSWAGARAFDAESVHQLVKEGVTGTGDFSSFLNSIFGGSAAGFRYTGQHRQDAALWAAFQYTVPVNKSHYFYSDLDVTGRVIGYHGTLFVNKTTAELERLVVTAEAFAPQVCQVEHVVDYGAVNIADANFRLPQASSMTVSYATGEVSINETQFSGCRKYDAESKIYFGDGPVLSPAERGLAPRSQGPIPTDTTLDVAIDPPVNSRSAAAGDPITGVVQHDVRHQGEVVVHKGDHLFGRLLRFEQTRFGVPTWIVTIRFDDIERQGLRQRISLRPLDDGERFLIPRMMVRRTQGYATPAVPTRPPGAGVFLFEGSDQIMLDHSFHSNWATQ
jgi:hypothetical protein